jgi:pimeloyl-ACP methyl ester carboxylesterase
MGDRREWGLQLDALAQDFTVLAWDAPGCGGSFDPPADLGLAGYADCLAELLSELGLERPHVLGLSFGSGLALELFRRHPQLPRSLVLASAWAGSLGRDAAEERRKLLLREAERPPEEVARAFSTTLFVESVPTALVDEMVAVMSSFHPAGLRAMVNAFADADLREVLPRIDIPTLLVYGDSDQRSPLHVAEDLHARIPDSELVVIPGPGHMVNVEAPERFNEVVREFLMSLPSA